MLRRDEWKCCRAEPLLSWTPDSPSEEGASPTPLGASPTPRCCVVDLPAVRMTPSTVNSCPAVAVGEAPLVHREPPVVLAHARGKIAERVSFSSPWGVVGSEDSMEYVYFYLFYYSILVFIFVDRFVVDPNSIGFLSDSHNSQVEAGGSGLVPVFATGGGGGGGGGGECSGGGGGGGGGNGTGEGGRSGCGGGGCEGGGCGGGGGEGGGDFSSSASNAMSISLDSSRDRVPSVDPLLEPVPMSVDTPQCAICLHPLDDAGVVGPDDQGAYAWPCNSPAPHLFHLGCILSLRRSCSSAPCPLCREPWPPEADPPFVAHCIARGVPVEAWLELPPDEEDCIVGRYDRPQLAYCCPSPGSTSSFPLDWGPQSVIPSVEVAGWPVPTWDPGWFCSGCSLPLSLAECPRAPPDESPDCPCGANDCEWVAVRSPNPAGLNCTWQCWHLSCGQRLPQEHDAAPSPIHPGIDYPSSASALSYQYGPTVSYLFHLAFSHTHFGTRPEDLGHDFRSAEAEWATFVQAFQECQLIPISQGGVGPLFFDAGGSGGLYHIATSWQDAAMDTFDGTTHLAMGQLHALAQLSHGLIPRPTSSGDGATDAVQAAGLPPISAGEAASGFCNPSAPAGSAVPSADPGIRLAEPSALDDSRRYLPPPHANRPGTGVPEASIASQASASRSHSTPGTRRRLVRLVAPNDVAPYECSSHHVACDLVLGSIGSLPRAYWSCPRLGCPFRRRAPANLVDCPVAPAARSCSPALPRRRSRSPLALSRRPGIPGSPSHPVHPSDAARPPAPLSLSDIAPPPLPSHIVSTPIVRGGPPGVRGVALSCSVDGVDQLPWPLLDSVDVARAFRSKVTTIREVPRACRGPYRAILAWVLRSIQESAGDAHTRAWKLWLLLPRMLLRSRSDQERERGGSGATSGRACLRQRFEDFWAGRWTALLHAAASPGGGFPQRSAPPTSADEEERRKMAAEWLVSLGEISRAAKRLCGASLADNVVPTWEQLCAQRPPVPLSPLPSDVVDFAPATPLTLDRRAFAANVRSAPRGSAPGRSGHRYEHLKILLDDEDGLALLTQAAEQLARATSIPPQIADALGVSALSAFSKGDGRVRGIATGDSLRRLTARTLAQQFGPEIDNACHPFQFALGTRAGIDAAVIFLRFLAEDDPGSVIISLDGRGAYDNAHRSAMLSKLRTLPQASAILPFCRLWYGRPSRYLFEVRLPDGSTEVRDVPQGEGGEQGDPLMPALYSLGQADSLREAQASLDSTCPGSRLIAYLDDVYIVTSRDYARRAYDIVTAAIEEGTGVASNVGKVRAWSMSGGPAPPGIAELGAGVWTGDLPVDQSGLIILGSPVGTTQFVSAFAEQRIARERALTVAISTLQDTQSAWLLLRMCAEPRANHLLRSCPPSQVQTYATRHDELLWNCLLSLLNLPADAASFQSCHRLVAVLCARFGGLGLRSAVRTSIPAYWAGWAGAIPVLHRKFPLEALQLVRGLEHESADILTARGVLRPLISFPSLAEVKDCVRRLDEAGFDRPGWLALLHGTVQPPQPSFADPGDVGSWEHGWQYHASQAFESLHFNSLLEALDPAWRALLRSQAGPGASAWLLALPTSPALVLPPIAFRACLLRRLRIALPLGMQNSSANGPAEERCPGRTCSIALDHFGDHCLSCNRSGRIQRRAKIPERAWAQVFREAGARCDIQPYVRDLGLPGALAGDPRRVDLVAHGLRFASGLPLVCDVTLRSPLTSMGDPVGAAAARAGSTFAVARADKRRQYADVATSPRCSFQVLASEIGGRFAPECDWLVRELCRDRVARVPLVIRRSLRLAWHRRWWGILSIAVQGAVAFSVGCTALPGLDRDAPDASEVLVARGEPPLVSRVGLSA